MIPVAIDPSERRQPGSPKVMAGRSRTVAAKRAPTAHGSPRRSSPRLRVRAWSLAAVGCVALGGVSWAAYSVMGNLAGPQVVRPNIHRMQNERQAQISAADLPDLRNGVPPLASEAPYSSTGADQTAGERPSAVAQASLPEPPTKPAPPTTVQSASMSARPVALPPIEPAGPAPVPSAVTPLAPSRFVSVIPPNSSQTTRARAAETTFASLPPEPAPAPARAKTVVTISKPKPVKATSTKATPEADAQPSAPAPAPEVEHSELFGLKVPSLAPAGRKIAEGVEALGDAVRNLPNQF